MYGLVFGVAIVAALGMTGPRVVPDSLDPPGPRGWLQHDPADSLYRRARETLNRRDYRAAADLFAQITARFPRSGYAADALYWQAFALYRAGGTRPADGAGGSATAKGAVSQGRDQGGCGNPGAPYPGRAGATRRQRGGRVGSGSG